MHLNLPVAAVPWAFLGCFGAVYWKNSFPWPVATWSSPKREASLALLVENKNEISFDISHTWNHYKSCSPPTWTNMSPPFNTGSSSCNQVYLYSESISWPCPSIRLWYVSSSCTSVSPSKNWNWSRCCVYLNCKFLLLLNHSFLSLY